MYKALARRGNELKWNLGVQVLLPRFFLYSLVPLTLLIAHSRDAWSFYWFPGFGWVAALFFYLFLLNVGANLTVSRYLRLHQSGASPYDYSNSYDSFANKPYFRISVRDNNSLSQPDQVASGGTQRGSNLILALA